MPRMYVVPTPYQTACDVIAGWHRHHRPPPGHMASFAVYDGCRLCGVAMVGRPVNPHLQAQGWLEVVRVATDGTPNACSALYGAVVRWVRGLNRIIVRAGGLPFVGIKTYILGTETGSSLRAANFTEDELPPDSSARRGRTWSRFAGHSGGGVAGPKRRFSFTFTSNSHWSNHE